MAERTDALLTDLHEEVRELLSEHHDKLEALADALLEHETLDEPAAYAAAAIKRENTGHSDDAPRAGAAHWSS